MSIEGEATLDHTHSAHADLPTPWRGAVRAVYDLESMTMVGDESFEIAPLEPGAGRVYLLGRPEQFNAARSQLRRNRINEHLRG